MWVKIKKGEPRRRIINRHTEHLYQTAEWDKLLKQSIVPWDEVDSKSLDELRQPQTESIMILIVSKNPPPKVFESKLKEWISEHNSEGWGAPLYAELSKPDVDIEIIKIYFKVLLQRRNRWNRIGRVLRKECDLGRLSPTNLQDLLTFLSHDYDGDAKSFAKQLLAGGSCVGGALWGQHDRESWLRLRAIVNGMSSSDESMCTPFLERYLQILLAPSAVHGCLEEDIDYALRTSYKATDHLELVAKFAPELFTEQNETTGNIFLHRILMLKSSHSKIIRRVMACCIKSIHIPNNQGRTPLGILLQHLVESKGPGRSEEFRHEYLGLCLAIAKNHPRALTSETLRSAGETTEPPPFLTCVGFLVPLLTSPRSLRPDYSTCSFGVDIARAFLYQVTNDCCSRIFDHSGNTGLHVAIQSSHNGWTTGASGDLATRILRRLMTAQATLTRNKHGMLPIDLALEQNKAPWIIEKLLKVSPTLLERRNNDSMLYPFQTVASQGKLSCCYSYLRMAPHMVSTALTEQNTAIFGTKKFIQSARLRCELEREWVIGVRRVKDLERAMLEERDRIEALKCKRLEDAEQLEEDARRSMRSL